MLTNPQTLAHEEKVLIVGLDELLDMISITEKLGDELPDPGSSVLLRELANSKIPSEAVNDCNETPILHQIVSIHSLVTMFIQVCRTGQVSLATYKL